MVAQFDHSFLAAGPGKWGAVTVFWEKQEKPSLLSWALLESRENPSQFSGLLSDLQEKAPFLEQTQACP